MMADRVLKTKIMVDQVLKTKITVGLVRVLKQKYNNGGPSVEDKDNTNQLLKTKTEKRLKINMIMD